MKQIIGFIGCGKMAQAMIGGMLKNGSVERGQLIASCKSEETLQKVESQFQIKTIVNNIEVAQTADLLFLAVPPQKYMNIIEDIRSVITPSTVVITIAAGITTNDVQTAFQRDVKVIRTMPNTPSLIQEGMSAMCANQHVTSEELQNVRELFESFGKVELIEEEQMDAIPAISGSSPAYVYMMIEAMADGGVKQGLSRDQAYRLASQAVIGAAKMVLETGIHPGELKDQVCSPGGATIAAVAELEKQQFRGGIQLAMEKCTEKVRMLGK
jgi:pyrroline-5-carboxylate reductase